MRRYESYKDSGVEWLGEVPHCWDVKKVKNIFHLIVEPAAKNNQCELLSVYTDIGVKPRAELEERGNKASTTDGYWIVKKGDIVVNKLLAWMGAIGLSEYDGVTSPAYDILRPHQQINGKFFHYLFRTPLCLSEFKKNSRGIMDMRLRLYFEELGNIYIPFPSYQEQQKIAQFLDDKTAKIDQAVDLAEKQIALLKEHKQILIQNAVTRGLNPDVPLKDSGVEWLGDVPAHWDIKRLKFMLSEKLKYGANESAESDDPEQPRYIRITDIDEQGNLKDDTFKSLEFEKAKDYLLNVNDILLARSGTVGKSYLYKENLKNFACYAGYLIRVRLEQKKFNAEFVNYYFQSIGYWNWIKSVNIQATIQNVSAEKYNDFLLSVPNLQEQATIVDYLDQKNAKIDQAIALKTAHIEKLKEYKSVLINDVVTGKVRV